MHINSIKTEVDSIIPHQTHCQTNKAEGGECNCNHKDVVFKINQLFLDVLKQRR